MQIISKFKTGEQVPKGSVYLTTVMVDGYEPVSVIIASPTRGGDGGGGHGGGGYASQAKHAEHYFLINVTK